MQRARDSQGHVVGERRRVAVPVQNAASGGIVPVESGGDRCAEACREFGADATAMARLLGKGPFDAVSGRTHGF